MDDKKEKTMKRITAMIMAWIMVISSFVGITDREAKAVEKEFKYSVEITRDGNTLKLQWNEKENADNYEVWKSCGAYSNFEKVSTVTTTNYTEEESDSVYKYYFRIVAKNNNQEIETSDVVSMDRVLWGDTVDIFSPDDDKSKINNRIKSISDKMMKASEAEWSDDRYVLMFKPGNYDIDKINVGFYTQVLGLGATPYETSIPNVNVDSAANGNGMKIAPFPAFSISVIVIAPLLATTKSHIFSISSIL